MRSLRRVGLLSLMASAVAVAGCAGCSTDADTADGTDASAGAIDSGTPRPDGSLPGDPDASEPALPDAGSPTAVEVCDGIDNDGNGIIDDVDVGKDGICDCLRIATLGYPGQWGEGDVFKSWLDAKSNNGAVSLGSQTLTAETLAQFQVIVVQDVREGAQGSEGTGQGIGRAYSDAEVEALKDWVNRGGGMMTLTGYADGSELSNANKLLAPFGLGYQNNGILAGGPTSVPVTHWTADHPIAQGVQAVGFNFGYPVTGGTLLAWEPNPGNFDVARVVEVGAGHVFAWGDEWITYNSEWQGRSDYQVERFWVNSIKWLTVAGNCQVPTGPN